MSEPNLELIQESMNRVLFAAEQHFDYMKRSLSSETGRYTVGECDQLWNDILGMRQVISEFEVVEEIQ
jgi:hypothetical protein